MQRLLFLLLIFADLAGCASDPNTFWYEGAMMHCEVSEIGPRQYKLVANGAGHHKQEEVERGFLFRAGQLCGGQEFSHEFQTAPYRYGLPGGGFPFYTAFKTTGIVKCK